LKQKEILESRFVKLEKHYNALREYKNLIDLLLESTNIYDPKLFEVLIPEKRAILEAYLKRFTSIQDFLGAKIFSSVLSLAGISTTKMSEVLSHAEKEGLIDSLESWVELRDARNELEHDYPSELGEALLDLKFCIDSFDVLEKYYKNSVHFYQMYI
jgi:hypothetical protein